MVKKRKEDLVLLITEYEEGDLSDKDTRKLFQGLLDSGLVWRLQGHYGRTAMSMLEAGILRPPKKPQRDFYGNLIDFSRFRKKKKLKEVV